MSRRGVHELRRHLDAFECGLRGGLSGPPNHLHRALRRGRPVDVLARALAEPMRQALGQSIVIENVVGANGTIGVGKAVHSAADGYTISIGNWPSHITNGAIYNLNYDIQKDLIPIARLPQNPYIAVVRKDFPANTFQEFIAWLKANPDKATGGTAGVGSGHRISGGYVQKITTAQFQLRCS